MYISTFLLPLALLPGALSLGPVPTIPSNHSSLPLVPYTYPPLEQIRYTLSLETFLLDAKDWSALNLVYTHDAVANFTSLGAGVWTGRDQIIANEQKALGAVTHGIHQISSSAILISPGKFDEARVTSYYTFNHFTVANGSQHVFQAWFKYQDQWINTRSYDGSPSSWRVKDRQVELIGGPVGADLKVERP